MDVIATIRNIETNPEFMRWKNVNEDAYLTSAFTMYSEGQKREWLISYHDNKTEKITTFSIGKQKRQEEAFKKEKEIPKLKIFEVKIKEDAALETAQEVLKNNYKNENVHRNILVLQKLDTEPIWNITFIAESFKVVTIRISAVTGKEISHSMSNVSDFMQSK